MDIYSYECLQEKRSPKKDLKKIPNQNLISTFNKVVKELQTKSKAKGGSKYQRTKMR